MYWDQAKGGRRLGEFIAWNEMRVGCSITAQNESICRNSINNFGGKLATGRVVYRHFAESKFAAADILWLLRSVVEIYSIVSLWKFVKRFGMEWTI